MTKRPELLLEHIRTSIRLVAVYLSGVDKQSFLASPQIQDSVCRRLEIIGEAAAKLPKDFCDAHPEVPWAKMRGMRNMLIHEYFQIDMQAVWTTATISLPELEKQLNTLT